MKPLPTDASHETVRDGPDPLVLRHDPRRINSYHLIRDRSCPLPIFPQGPRPVDDRVQLHRCGIAQAWPYDPKFFQRPRLSVCSGWGFQSSMHRHSVMVQRLQRSCVVGDRCGEAVEVVTSVSWNESGTLLMAAAGESGEELHIYDFSERSLIEVYSPHRDAICWAEFLPGRGDEKIVSNSMD